MNYPRTEYDYGTAAIELCFYTPAQIRTYAADVARLKKRQAIEERIEKIERSHAAHPARVRRTSAARWVWRTYPHHFSLVVI